MFPLTVMCIFTLSHRHPKVEEKTPALPSGESESIGLETGEVGDMAPTTRKQQVGGDPAQKGTWEMGSCPWRLKITNAGRRELPVSSGLKQRLTKVHSSNSVGLTGIRKG